MYTYHGIEVIGSCEESWDEHTITINQPAARFARHHKTVQTPIFQLHTVVLRVENPQPMHRKRLSFRLQFYSCRNIKPSCCCFLFFQRRAGSWSGGRGRGRGVTKKWLLCVAGEMRQYYGFCNVPISKHDATEFWITTSQTQQRNAIERHQTIAKTHTQKKDEMRESKTGFEVIQNSRREIENAKTVTDRFDWRTARPNRSLVREERRREGKYSTGLRNRSCCSSAMSASCTSSISAGVRASWQIGLDWIGYDWEEGLLQLDRNNIKQTKNVSPTEQHEQK